MITTGCRVEAHTGSPKTRDYAVITGEVTKFETRDLGPRHYVVVAVILGEDGRTYRTTMSRMKQIARENSAPVAQPEPRTIKFERVRCTRCGGQGRRNDRPGWNVTAQGVCFKCQGKGTTLTANGYRAEQAYSALRDERLGATWGTLAVGDVFWFEGRAYTKGNHPSLRLQPETPVMRHDGPATRQMWREIAKRFKGATLVY
jgi:hypothetical protein